MRFIHGLMPASPRDLRARLTRHADLVLAALVVGAVGMMIVPLPPFLLDLFITLNISVALAIVITTQIGRAHV